MYHGLMMTHKLPGKGSTAHEMCAQIFLKMQNRSHLQVFGQGTGEGNSPRRKEGKKGCLSCIHEKVAYYAANSNLPPVLFAHRKCSA